jgi:protein-S-isoprenylcysteine O-methyltransferase Ste14
MVIILAIFIIVQLIFLPRLLKKGAQNPQGFGLPWYKKSLVFQPVSAVVGSVGFLFVMASIGNLIPSSPIFYFLGLICIGFYLFYLLKRNNANNIKAHIPQLKKRFFEY